MPDGVEHRGLHQTSAVEEQSCPSAVGSKSLGAVELVEEEAFDCFGRLISIEAAMFKSELLCLRVGQFLDVIRHFFRSPDNRLEYLAALAVGTELRFKAIASVTPRASSDLALEWQSMLTFFWRALTTALGMPIRSSG